MDTKLVSHILSFSPHFCLPTLSPPSSLGLSVRPGCPPLFNSVGLSFGCPSVAPTHTQTQSMHFRQGANGKINYQQAKALALHFCRRKRKGHGVGGGQEKVSGNREG